MRVWHFLLAVFGGQYCTAQNLEVAEILARHGAALSEAVSMVKSIIPNTSMDIFIPPFDYKQKGSNVPARELTMVDSALSMTDAVKSALGKNFPHRSSRLDNVLKVVIKEIALAGSDVVGLRRDSRRVLAQASRVVHSLNLELQGRVPEFGRPIVGHVNFAMIEVLVRAVGWRHPFLMHDVLCGFQPIGDVCSTFCMRPVDEPVP